MQLTLKAIRINKGDTQEQTAKSIGVSVETWANYEKGLTYPDIPVLKRIEEYFEVKYSDINFLLAKNNG